MSGMFDSRCSHHGDACRPHGSTLHAGVPATANCSGAPGSVRRLPLAHVSPGQRCRESQPATRCGWRNCGPPGTPVPGSCLRARVLSSTTASLAGKYQGTETVVKPSGACPPGIARPSGRVEAFRTGRSITCSDRSCAAGASSANGNNSSTVVSRARASRIATTVWGRSCRLQSRRSSGGSRPPFSPGRLQRGRASDGARQDCYILIKRQILV